jgi:hypothetical protein
MANVDRVAVNGSGKIAGMGRFRGRSLSFAVAKVHRFLKFAETIGVAAAVFLKNLGIAGVVCGERQIRGPEKSNHSH